MAMTGNLAGLDIFSEVIKTTNYTVTYNDRGALLLGNSASNIIFGLPAVAGLSGFSLTIKNINATGLLTIDPSGIELIEAQASFSLGQNESVRVYCNGSTWRITDNNNGLRASQNLAELPNKGAARANMGVDVAVPVMIPTDGSSDLNTLTAAGWYLSAIGSTNANLPTSGIFGYLQTIGSAPSNNITQIFYEQTIGSNLARIWTRSRISGSWSLWNRVFTSGSILGTVSQSSGFPTGAILEKGSNANGDYIRYADGTQICWVEIDDTATAWNSASGTWFSRSTNVVWTYPAAFIANPIVQGNVRRNVVAQCTAGITALGTTTVQILPGSSVTAAAAAAKFLQMLAIGRWF